MCRENIDAYESELCQNLRSNRRSQFPRRYNKRTTVNPYVNPKVSQIFFLALYISLSNMEKYRHEQKME